MRTADFEKNGATKEKERAEIGKLCSEELLALADAIKMLNDDDALELFKKTPRFQRQLHTGRSQFGIQALAILEAAKTDKKSDSQRIDCIVLANRGKWKGAFPLP